MADVTLSEMRLPAVSVVERLMAGVCSSAGAGERGLLPTSTEEETETDIPVLLCFFVAALSAVDAVAYAQKAQNNNRQKFFFSMILLDFQ